MSRLVLIKPNKEYQEKIIAMLDEWSEYNATHVTDLSPHAIFHDYHNYDEYLAYFEQAEKNPKPGYVPSTTYFALDKERDVIVGAISIRHYLNESLLQCGGHIGDGIRPSERRKGYATEMISLALDKCVELGIDKVMMSCNDDNVGSRKSIINNGGIYEKTIISPDERIEIYWIDISNRK